MLDSVTPPAHLLLRFQSSLLPPRNLRITGAVAVGVIFTLATSPLAPLWLLFIFALAVILASLWTGARNSARGLRSNSYAPMRPDAETSVALGGDVPLPRPWWKNLDVWLPLAYIVICFAVSDTLGTTGSPTAGWIAAVALGCLATAGLLWWWVRNNAGPVGYIPLSTLLADAPQWRPADDDSAVAAVLYAAPAYPRGRQMRRDALDTQVAALFGTEQDAVSRALARLAGHREVLVHGERDRSGVREEWVSLSPAGVDAVTASFRTPVG